MSKKEKSTTTNDIVQHEELNIPELTREQQSFYGRISTLVEVHLNTVDDYIKVMAPGNMINPNEGAYQTQRLYSAIMAIIEAKKIEDMIDGMDGLLRRFDEHRNGALSLMYTQRFIDVWMINDVYRDLFTHLCHIFLVFSEPTKREKQGKNMQLGQEGGMLQNLNGIYRDRLIEYLNRYTS